MTITAVFARLLRPRVVFVTRATPSSYAAKKAATTAALARITGRSVPISHVEGKR